MATKSFTMAPKKWGLSVRHLLHVNVLELRTLRRLLNLGKFAHSCSLLRPSNKEETNGRYRYQNSFYLVCCLLWCLPRSHPYWKRTRINGRNSWWSINTPQLHSQVLQEGRTWSTPDSAFADVFTVPLGHFGTRKYSSDVSPHSNW
jgi:hypothetical protein